MTTVNCGGPTSYLFPFLNHGDQKRVANFQHQFFYLCLLFSNTGPLLDNYYRTK